MTYIITNITDADRLGNMYETFALSLMLPFDEEIIDSQERLVKELRDFNVKQYRQQQKSRHTKHL